MRSSSETDTSAPSILLTGNSGAGKTIAAATFSKHFPHDRLKELTLLAAEKGAAAVAARLAELPWIHLDDLYWVPFDIGALDGLRAMKVSVPFLPVQEIEAKYIEKAEDAGEARNLPIMPRILAQCGQMLRQDLDSVEGKKIEATITDTITVLDVGIAMWCDAKFKFPVNEITSLHKQWYGILRGTGRGIIACAHLEALTDPVKATGGDAGEKAAADQKLRQEAAKGAGGGKLVAAMQRRARQLWEANCSDQFAIERKRVGKVDEFTILTEATSPTGMAARSRAELLLNPREPVNLRALMIRTGKVKG